MVTNPRWSQAAAGRPLPQSPHHTGSSASLLTGLQWDTGGMDPSHHLSSVA